jgi:hypothetical protein
LTQDSGLPAHTLSDLTLLAPSSIGFVYARLIFIGVTGHLLVPIKTALTSALVRPDKPHIWCIVALQLVSKYSLIMLSVQVVILIPLLKMISEIPEIDINTAIVGFIIRGIS